MKLLKTTGNRGRGKLYVLLALVSFSALGGYATQFSNYETSDWNPNGYGNWSEATRWMSGSPLPTEQDRSVLITAADAFATDADYNVLQQLIRLRFSGTASLDIEFHGSVHRKTQG